MIHPGRASYRPGMGFTRRGTIAALAASLVSVIPARPAAAQPLPPEAARCEAALAGARDDLARTHRMFRSTTVEGLAPEVRPTIQGGPGRKATPGFVRHGWGAGAELQRLRVPEYYYVDVVDRRDDQGDWAALAGDDTWRCRDRASGAQHNLDCARRRGTHVAIVRATHWRRATPRHVAAYLVAFKAATEVCLVPAPPARGTPAP